MTHWIPLVVAGTVLYADLAAPQGRRADDDPNPDAVRVFEAVRTPQPPTIDGYLDEPMWALAPVATDFIQAQPNPGSAASERTEVRLLYDDQALYVGVRLYDSRPEAITAPLARPDQNVYSDWFAVALDTYRDRRTAFVFAVNPRGVKRDLRLFDDRQEDAGWDAVWQVAARVDAEGWTAEFRIPLSQLRFPAPEPLALAEAGGGSDAAVAAAAPAMVWGINFTRTLARREEVAHWSPTPPDAAGIVSRFGELRGLQGLRPPRRLELQPYTVARLARAPGEASDPFYRPNDLFGSVGLDLQYGLTSDLTLTATLNPDFGQVEADPAVVNLTAFESYFEEKRPFFSEGAEIFHSGWPQLFYSRRIGRAPQGSAPPQAAYSQSPEATTILGAAKLTGRLPGGWSVGLLNAVTAAEDLRYVDAAGEEHRAHVEPLTSYTVGRATRDFRQGRSTLGGLFTATHRWLEAEPLRALLPASAYSGGLDWRHRFSDGSHQITGALLASQVQGSDSAVARLQRAPGRYFQRPDAAHLRYDPGREALGGYSGRLAVRRIGGGSWRWSTSVSAHSPGFEINDLGFGFGSDEIVQHSMLGYEQHRPGRLFQNWALNIGQMSHWTFGAERRDAALDLYGEAQFLNHWGGSLWYMRHLGGLVPGALRGGPALLWPARQMGAFGLYSDRRQPLRFSLGNYWEVEDGTGSRQLNLHTTVALRVADRLTASLRPSVGWNTNSWQYVGRRSVADETYYLLGRLEQTTASLTARVDYTFSPALSLQLYAQPFVSAGAYSEFRTVQDSRAAEFAQRFHTFTPEEISATPQPEGPLLYRVDLNGNGSPDLSFSDPSFNIRHFRSNAVLRWEYRPGSTLFVVWSQNRSGFDPEGTLDPGRDTGRLFGTPGTNVLLVKLSYWLGL